MGIPGMPEGWKLDLNPFNDDDDKPDDDSAQGVMRRLRSAAREWRGEGVPPSRDAALGRLIQHGFDLPEARKIVGRGGASVAMGQRVRAALSERKEDWRRQNEVKATEAASTAGLDTDQSGDITAEELVTAAEDGTLESILAEGPGALNADAARGAPLWRYEASAETLAGLEVKNESVIQKHSGGTGFLNAMVGALEPDGPGTAEKTGARYYEQDTLEPLKWSAEQRADLQRVLHGIGLYGDAKVKLGSWTAKDQAVYAELLASSNEEGLTWFELLAKWKRNPPEDLLAELEDSGKISKRPPVQVTNPLDIMQTSKEVSRSLTGEVDRGFVEGTVAPYQGLETSSQNAAYDLSEAGGGGTYAAPPSVAAFADDRLRREDPIEVDGYQFLTQFQSLMSMLGVQ